MSTFTPITLNGSVSSTAALLAYGESDGTGMQLQNQTYTVVVTITAQSTGDSSSRKAGEYNGIDVTPGMWISDSAGDTVLRIKSISQKAAASITAVVEDVDMLSFRLNNINAFAASAGVIIFGNNSEGEALITNTSGFTPAGIDKVQSRFLVNEADDRVKFTHTVAPTLEKGDIVTVASNGNLVKYGTAGASAHKVGTVLDIIRNGKDVFVKPFNDIIRDYDKPESLGGTPGQIYYTDSNNIGGITYSDTSGNATYLQLTNSIASSQVITAGLPDASDIININGIEVWNGGVDAALADLAEFVVAINDHTSQHNVVASGSSTPVVLQGGDFAPEYAPNDFYAISDSYVTLGTPGNHVIGAITISDGLNTGVVTFDNPDDTIDVGGTIYDICSPTAQLVKFNAAISAYSLNITADLYDMVGYDGQAVRLTSNGAATEIVLTNTAPAAFGLNVVGPNSWTGIGMSVTIGNPVLTLNRVAGGSIELTGSPISGGWLNANGAVSSNSGKPAYLLLIEAASVAASAETGIAVKTDKNFTPSVTVVDGDTTGAAITYTPFQDGGVEVLVNGVGINLGAGLDCYFSSDGGTTAKLEADIEAADILYWNGSVAGYQLEADDDIDFTYDASSNDV
tara:strand:+ start:1004 stop:2881 length:1878 start_codon:yes stop_codon:yes gene_type:complete